MAAQCHMSAEGDTILHVLPILIDDEDDRNLCEALYYILLKNEADFSNAAERLSHEINNKLDVFILNNKIGGLWTYQR